MQRYIHLDRKRLSQMANITIEFPDGAVYRGAAYCEVATSEMPIPYPFTPEGDLSRPQGPKPLDWDLQFHGTGPLELVERDWA